MCTINTMPKSIVHPEKARTRREMALWSKRNPMEIEPTIWESQ